MGASLSQLSNMSLFSHLLNLRHFQGNNILCFVICQIVKLCPPNLWPFYPTIWYFFPTEGCIMHFINLFIRYKFSHHCFCNLVGLLFYAVSIPRLCLANNLYCSLIGTLVGSSLLATTQRGIG